MANANGKLKTNGKTNGHANGKAKVSKAKLSHGRESTHDAEVRRDRLGRRINPKSLENLNPFPPGVSGNPSGSYRSRPFTSAIAVVAEMEVQDLRPKPTDKAALAMTKAIALQAMKGKVPAYTDLADRFEGRAGTRMQYENVPGVAGVSVEETRTTTVQVTGDTRDLDEILDDIYGLRNWNRRTRRGVVVVVRNSFRSVKETVTTTGHSRSHTKRTQDLQSERSMRIVRIMESATY